MPTEIEQTDEYRGLFHDRKKKKPIDIRKDNRKSHNKKDTDKNSDSEIVFDKDDNSNNDT